MSEVRTEADSMQVAELDGQRHRLTGLAYRMLGTVADAEDAVQEAFVRWLRLSPSQRADIQEPSAWFTRVTARVCLDMLGTARARREHYVGQWLPEPIPGNTFEAGGAIGAGAAPDALDRLALDESVSMALLIVLDTLTPAERVAFVLHEVFSVPFSEVSTIVGRSAGACRQLATSARRRVREQKPQAMPPVEHGEVVRAFVDACSSGDVEALARVLDPAVVLRSDGGGAPKAARNPVVGQLNVARLLLGIVSKEPGLAIDAQPTADGLSLVVSAEGQVSGVVSFGFAGARVAEVWISMNPEKLSLWKGAS